MVLDHLDSEATLADLLILQVFSLDAELEVELPACLQRLVAVVGISLDVLKQLVRCVFVCVQHILDHFKSEDFPLELVLVLDELLLLGWDFAGEHCLARSLLLGGRLPVLEGLDPLLQGTLLVAGRVGSLLVQGGLSIDDEWKEL